MKMKIIIIICLNLIPLRKFTEWIKILISNNMCIEYALSYKLFIWNETKECGEGEVNWNLLMRVDVTAM